MIVLLLLLQDVRAELDRLASPDVEIRQAAEAALLAMGEAAIPEIERRSATSDAEIRGRVAGILRRLRWWEHEVLFRGRKIDLRTGLARPTSYGPLARVAGERIVDAAATSIRGFDLKTERELWTREPLGEIWGVEAGASSILIRTPKGLSCLDAAGGRELWTSPGHRAEPLSGGDWLVAAAAGLSRKGSTSWTIPGAPCELAAAGPWVLSTGPAARARLLDVRDGKALRTLDLPAYRAAQAGVDLLLIVGGGTLAALKPSDGSMAWTRPDVGDATRVLVEGKRVYVADHSRMCCGIKLYALDVETGAPLWTAPAQGIPADHSKYRHDARLARVGAYLALTGEAAAGDYVEAFHPESGARVSRWTSR